MSTKGCRHCAGREGTGFDRPFTMAFQPIFDLRRGEIFAHEALLRTPEGGPAGPILDAVTPENRYSFDQQCRVTAIELAARHGLKEGLSINFMPNAVYDPDACIAKTLWAADRWDVPIESIIFEFTEGERIEDVAHLARIVERYRARGFRTAIDDFGAGYAGLGLLADIQPDLIKVDMKLIRGIDADPVRQHIFRSIVDLTARLGITVIAEGVETAAELAFISGAGVELVQGFGLARPRLGLVPAEAIREVVAPMRRAS
jgi:EAL domain-containing protein (putative c-di-GMP-specific phosphodiesterase class I)